MKFLLLLSLFVLGACETRTLNTSQPFFIDVIGTDEAYCIVSSPHYRYAVNAPGQTNIERSADDLKVDCRDNAIQRRRTMVVSPEWDELFYRYPETVTVDFSSLDNGSRYNGYRAPIKETQLISTASEPIEAKMSKKIVMDTVLTEDSYSQPVPLNNDTMVEKTYTMGRRSYPVALTDETNLRNKYELTPQISSETVVLEHDPSITVFPMQ